MIIRFRLLLPFYANMPVKNSIWFDIEDGACANCFKPRKKLNGSEKPNPIVRRVRLKRAQKVRIIWAALRRHLAYARVSIRRHADPRSTLPLVEFCSGECPGQSDRHYGDALYWRCSARRDIHGRGPAQGRTIFAINRDAAS